MREKIIIAGAGGQGIMLLGKVMAQAALKEDKFVTWFPSYGAEVRGGTAYCMVVISDTDIGSPYIEKADTLIIMNQPSLEKFKTRLKNKGLLIINSSLVACGKKNACFCHPFTDIALKLGNIRVANIIALGYYLARKNTISVETVLETIDKVAAKDKKELVAKNQKALKEGLGLKDD